MSRLDSIHHHFDDLPLFARSLTAVRMIRRAVLGIIPAQDDPEHTFIMQICAACEECITNGGGVHKHLQLFKDGMQLREQPEVASDRFARSFLRSALWWMIDSVKAADYSQDFAFDATVGRSAHTCLALLASDPQLNKLQMAVLLASDVDQLHFTCGEINLRRSQSLAATYAGLGDYIMQRLTPTHALTVERPTPSPESLCR